MINFFGMLYDIICKFVKRKPNHYRIKSFYVGDNEINVENCNQLKSTENLYIPTGGKGEVDDTINHIRTVTKKVLLDEKSSLNFLIDIGTHDKDGTVNKNYNLSKWEKDYFLREYYSKKFSE